MSKTSGKKLLGLEKWQICFNLFFHIFPSGTFFITLTPCCLSISSCSSPPQIVLFLILLYFLNINYRLSSHAHLTDYQTSITIANKYRSSWQYSSWIKSPNITIKELMLNIFSHFRLFSNHHVNVKAGSWWRRKVGYLICNKSDYFSLTSSDILHLRTWSRYIVQLIFTRSLVSSFFSIHRG